MKDNDPDQPTRKKIKTMDSEQSRRKMKHSKEQSLQFEALHYVVNRTFSDIVKKSIVTRNIYS